MKIEKLSKKIDIDVEAQLLPRQCNDDYISGITYTGNQSLLSLCRPRFLYTQWISKVK